MRSLGYGVAVFWTMLAGVGTAQQSDGLIGRDVVFTVVTYDDPAAPYLVSRDYIARVADGPEFGMVREGTPGLDVVPVLIDVDARQITFDYSVTGAGFFFEAKFNGYVLEFLTDCVLITGAKINKAATTLPLTQAALLIKPSSLGIDVAGFKHTPMDRIVIDVDVADCPLG